MATKQYTYKTRKTPAQPRNKRLTDVIRETVVTASQGGGQPGGGGGGTITADFDIRQGDGISVLKNTQGSLVFTVAHANTSDAVSSTNKDSFMVRNLTLDEMGHVTEMESANVAEIFDERYLRKDIDDTAHGNITFDQSVGSTIYLPGFEGKGWRIEPDGVATMDGMNVRHNLFVGNRVGSPKFISGFPNGLGWDLSPYKRINAAEVEETKWRLELDDLTVRGKLRVYEMVISQLRGENDNVIFAGMMKVDHYDAATGRIYLDTDKGVLYNPFRPGDILMVQRFGGLPSAGNQYNVIKQYELRVTEAGVGSLTDGENRLDWISFSNFVGELSDIAERDVLTRVDSVSDSTRKGIVKVTTIDEIGAPYIDVVYGMKTDPEHATKVRAGNLSGVRTRNNLDLTGVWGLYAEGAVIENSSVYLDNGMTIEQNFTVMNGELNSKIESIKNDMSLEKDNILRNSSFSRDLNYWETQPDVHFIQTADGYIYANRFFYVEKSSVADIWQEGDRNVLRIRSSYVKQPGSVMNGDRKEGTYSFSLRYKVIRPGQLRVGIEGSKLYRTEELTPTADFERMSLTEQWNGQGDFIIATTGEVLVYAVSLFNDALADAVIHLQTQITQNAEEIKLTAKKEYVDAETGKIYTKYDSALTVQAESISAISTKVDNINHTIETAGWITSAQGNKLFAAKELENGNKIISYINQSATNTTISSNRIDLVGAVTFNSFDWSLQQKINGIESDAATALSDANDAWNKAVAAAKDATSAYNRAGTAISDASTAISNAAAAVKKAGSVEAALNDLPAWSKKASIIEALTSATVIVNGYISTSMIDVDNLYATHLNATVGTVGGFTISGNALENDKLLLTGGIIEFKEQMGVYARIGAVSAAAGGQQAAKFRNTYNSGGYNSNGFVLKLECGQSRYKDVPQVWLDCVHYAGHGSGFRVESRYTGDDNQMERTFFYSPNVVSRTTVSSMPISNSYYKEHVFHRVLFDAATGFFCLDF